MSSNATNSANILALQRPTFCGYNLTTSKIKVNSNIHNFVNDKQRDCIDFILRNYIKECEDELELSKLPTAINLKFGIISGAERNLVSLKEIQKLFIGFQKYLYLN